MFSGAEDNDVDVGKDEESKGGESEELEKKYNDKSNYSAGIKSHHLGNRSSSPTLTKEQRQQNRKIFSKKRSTKLLE